MATITKQIVTSQNSNQDMSISDGKGTSKAAVVWLVQTESNSDQAVDCLEAFPVKRGMYYNVEGNVRETLICTNITCKKLGLNSQTSTPAGVFEVTVEYTGIQNTPPDPEEPYSSTFTVSMGEETGQEPIIYDGNENLILNSADDLFDTPPVVQTGATTFTITRSEYVNPVVKKQNYSDKYGVVNSDTIWGFPPRTLRIQITTDYSKDSGWTVSYTFKHNPETWDIKITDKGYNYYEGTGENRIKKQAVVDENGEPVPVHEPIALNGSGGKTTNDQAAVLSWRRCKEMSFAALNLPNIAGI